MIESDKALEGDDVASVIAILSKYDSLDQTISIALAHIEDAKSSLARFEQSKHAEALCQIADYIAYRKV